MDRKFFLSVHLSFVDFFSEDLRQRFQQPIRKVKRAAFAQNRQRPGHEAVPERVVERLLRRWEIEQVLEPGADVCIEEAGKASDGETLYAVFRREVPTGESDPGAR